MFHVVSLSIFLLQEMVDQQLDWLISDLIFVYITLFIKK